MTSTKPRSKARGRSSKDALRRGVASNGPFLLFTKGKDGDASYVACAVIH